LKAEKKSDIVGARVRVCGVCSYANESGCLPVVVALDDAVDLHDELAGGVDQKLQDSIEVCE